MSLFLAMLCFIGAGVACQFPPGNLGDIPAPPGGQIQVSQEAADRLRSNFNREVQEAGSGSEFRLFITNEEITSFVTVSLRDVGTLPLSDPQVWFTAGKIYLTGTFSPFWPFSFRSLIVATAVVHDGQMQVAVERAQMGPFPFPEQVLQSASQSINETLAETQLDLQVTNLQILEGELQLAGIRRPVT